MDAINSCLMTRFYCALGLQDEISCRGCNESLIHSESGCTIALRIRIDDQHSMAPQSELRRDIDD
jgi:hypothetical protein